MHDSEYLFAYKVRQALDHNLAQLPTSTAQALVAARHAAIRRKKKKVQFTAWLAHKVTAGYPGIVVAYFTVWAKRLAVAAPIVAAMVGLFGVYQSAQQRQVNELADEETQIMTDELPVAAYLDKGFSAYLEQQEKLSHMDSTSFIQTNPPVHTHQKTS